MSTAPSSRLLYSLVALGAVGPVAIALWAWPHIPSDPVERGAVIAGLFSRNQTPAVAALREIGCEHAFVTTVGQIAERSPVGERSPVRDRPMITCTDAFGRTPTCEDVAATFAPFAPDQDWVIVRLTSDGKPVCHGLYATTGELGSPDSMGSVFGEVDPADVRP